MGAKMKRCPKCGKDLKSKVLGTLEVDECESCKGVWLDRGELGEAEESVDPNLNWLDFEIWKHPEKFKSKETGLKCPSCATNTINFEYGHTGVEINYCPSCHGIWLEKDELPKIIESLEDEISKKTVSDYVHESIREAKEIVTGQGPVLDTEADAVQAVRRETETDRDPDRSQYAEPI